MDPIPVRLPEDLQARVDALSKELSISRSSVLRLAIQQWLDAVELRGINPMLMEKASPVGAETPQKVSGPPKKIVYPKGRGKAP